MSVTWREPKKNGGSPLTTYVLTASPGHATTQVTADALAARVDGLANGVAYKLTVHAVNAAGKTSTESSARHRITPTSTVPASPDSVTATSAGMGQLTVTWRASSADTGSPTTGFEVIAEPGHVVIDAGPDETSVSFYDLSLEVDYTVSVRAESALGRSAAATASPVRPNIQSVEGALPLDATALAAVSAVYSDAVSFIDAPAQILALQGGDVIAAGVSATTPDGLFRVVNAVTTVDGVTTVATSPAALDQAITTGDLSITGVLGRGDVAKFAPAQPGFTLEPGGGGDVADDDLSIVVDADLYTDRSGDSVRATGRVVIGPQVELGIQIHDGVVSATYSAELDETAALSIDAHMSRSITKNLPLGTVTFEPIVIFIGWLPVVIVPQLELTLSVSGTVSVGLTTSVTATASSGVALTVNDGGVDVRPINRHAFSYVPPTILDDATFKIGPAAAFSLLLYGVSGPYIRDTLDLASLSASTTADPWWTLTAENRVSAGFSLSALGTTLVDWSKDPPFHTTVPIADAGGPYMGVTITPDPAAVDPGETLQLSASVARCPDQTVTWNVAPGDGVISKSGLYTAPATPGTYHVTATSPASGLKPVTRGIIDIRVGSQPPESPTDVTATSVDRGTADVTWTAPTDTGGSPITSYSIETSPGGATATVDGDSYGVRLSGLTPGALYFIRVTAVNSAGTSNPSSTPRPVRISSVLRLHGTTEWSSLQLDTRLRSLVAVGTDTITGLTCGTDQQNAIIGMRQGDASAFNVVEAQQDGRHVDCVQDSAVDTDGTAYAVETWNDDSDPGYSPHTISAYKDGVRVWSRTFAACASPFGPLDVALNWLTLGPNGDLYLVAARQLSCDSETSELLELDATTGDTKFSQTLTGPMTIWDDAFGARHMFAYAAGIIVIDGSTVRYFDYDGVEDVSRDFDISPLLPADTWWAYASVSADGDLLVNLWDDRRSPTDPCNNALEHVLVRSLGGAAHIVDLGQCYGALQTPTVQWMPGGRWLLRQYSDSEGASFDVLNEAGERLYGYVPSAPDGATLGGTSVVVDSDGDLLFVVGYARDGGYGFVFHMMDPAGVIADDFDSAALATPGDNPDIRFVTAALADDHVFVATCGGPCGAGRDETVHSIRMPGVGAGYTYGDLV